MAKEKTEKVMERFSSVAMRGADAIEAFLDAKYEPDKEEELKFLKEQANAGNKGAGKYCSLVASINNRESINLAKRKLDLIEKPE
jgi:hypothetical protein